MLQKHRGIDTSDDVWGHCILDLNSVISEAVDTTKLVFVFECLSFQALPHQERNRGPQPHDHRGTASTCLHDDFLLGAANEVEIGWTALDVCPDSITRLHKQGQ